VGKIKALQAKVDSVPLNPPQISQTTYGLNQGLHVNPLKTKLIYILFRNPVRTSKRTPNFTITKINWLMLIKEIITAYSENHAKPIKTKYSITDCHSSCFI
jgi:hypothetical protein